MIKISQYGNVTRFDSARTIFRQGFYWSTAYLVDGMLIDTGCAHTARELMQALHGTELTRIVNTHTHEDHIGANGILQETWSGMEVCCHPLALPVIRNPRAAQPLQLYRRVMWGWPQPSTGSPVQDGELLQTEHYAFQVIYTPGHSPDHICLYEPDQEWLFTGDLFNGGKDRALREGYHIWQIIASLKRVAQLPLHKLFPGCARVRENPAQLLTNKISYLEEKGSQVLELHRQGIQVAEIARLLFGGPMLIEFVTAGHFTRRHLVRSYLETENLT